MTQCIRRPRQPNNLPPGDFRLLIQAINRGVENEIVDEATRIARIAINAKRPYRRPARAASTPRKPLAF